MTRSVGAGLEPARAARSIQPGERIHIVGVAGAGASAAAILASRAGAMVTGCDSGGPSPYTEAVEAAGLPITWTHEATHVTGVAAPDRLAVTKALTAIDPDNPELVAARDAGIAVESWQQVIADVAFHQRLIGIAGTHGKSTTAGWLVHVLVAAGVSPSAFVGALLDPRITNGPASTARVGAEPIIVVEADEYAGNFDSYHPDVIVLTSLEWDHPDVFPDLDAVSAAFEQWIRAAGEGQNARVLVANVGDPEVADLVRRIHRDWPGHIVVTKVVEDPDADLLTLGDAISELLIDGQEPVEAVLGRITAMESTGTDFDLFGRWYAPDQLRVHLATAGRHNVANALGVFAAARTLGLTPEQALRGLATFQGVGRRLERKGEAAGVVVYDDYAHHPTAIRETLRAIRQREPGRPVWAVYEPLTYHRTAALLDAFAEVLADAHGVVIADIWAGRDPDTTITSARALADAVAARRPGIVVAAPGSVDDTAAWLATNVNAGDAVLVMGGGQSYRIAELLLEALGTEDAR